jgi:hypothetical protein
MGRYKGGGKTPSEKLGGRCAGDLTILQVRSGFAPISAHLIFEEHFFFRFSSADRQLATVGLRAAWNGYWTTALEPSANIIVSSGRASGRAGDSALSGPERSLDARADVLVVVLSHIIRCAFESFVTTTAR